MASEKVNYYMSSLVNKLQSLSASTVQKALISLTRATKNLENVAKFRVEGGIKLLLEFIQTSNRKTVDMSVSVLANCALEKESRAEITNQNGLIYLYNILTSLNETSILSRAARAFANLCVDEAIAQQVIQLDVTSKLVHHLKETNDALFKQNVIRALRIIGKVDSGKKELVHCNGIQLLIDLLQGDDHEVKSCCLQSLQELSKTGNRQVAEHIQEFNAIEVVIGMTYSENSKIRETAIMTLSNITKNASVRVSVGTIGGIEAFIYQIKNRTAQHLAMASIEGICMCCREAVNRNKVRSCGGLEVLLGVLRCPEYSQAHDRILGAFVCFSYDELALNCLIANGIVPLLLSFLRRILFRGNLAKVSEKTECLSPISSLGKESVYVRQKQETSSMISSMTSSTTKPATCTPKSKINSVQPVSKNDHRLSLDISPPSALSPPRVLSPSCSPELYLSYMSPVSPQSINDNVPSPMVYSPSGSEVEDSDEEHEDDNETSLEKESTNSIEDTSFAKNVSNVLLSNNGAPTSRDWDSLDQGGGDVLESTNRPILLHPDTSYHLHMFLPKENLFSADQPSPKKTNTPPSQRSHRIRRTLSRSTSSTSPEEAIPPPTPHGTIQPSSPYSTELQGPENKILFLLSRFGQMPNPTEALITPQCIQTLLDYQSFSQKPNPRCFRLLNRLMWDINFFEANVLHMVPGAFYRQLVCGFGPRYDLRPHPGRATVDADSDGQVSMGSHRVLKDCPKKCGDTSLPKDPAFLKDTKTSDLAARDSIKSKELVQSHDLSPSKDLAGLTSPNAPCTNITESPSTKQTDFLDDPEMSCTFTEASVYCQNVSAEILGDAMKGDFSIKPSHTTSIGWLLLTVMTNQACTSFGEGQLAHLLLRGSQKQKRACALSLPFLCRPMRLKRRLLLEYNGLLLILSALSDPVEEDDTLRAIEALTYLISSSSLTLNKPMPSELALGNTALATHDCPSKSTSCNSTETTPTILREDSRSKDLSTNENFGAEEEPKVLPKMVGDENASARPCKRRKLETCEETAVFCCYTSYGEEEKMYDVMLKLDDGRSIMAHRSVLSAISDVFAAMLSSDFVESSQSEVNLRHIEYDVLLSIVHYAYGCLWSFEPDPQCEHLCAFLKKCLPDLRSQSSYGFIADLLVCADRFLIENLKKQCVQLLLWSISKKRVKDLYLFGVCYGAPVLRRYCLKYMFLGNVNLCCLYQNMRELIDSEERHIVLDDLKRISLECF